jgi:hypothetical protein
MTQIWALGIGASFGFLVSGFGFPNPPSWEIAEVYNCIASRFSLQFATDMDFLKSVGGKIATGLVLVAVFVAGISWWQAGPATRQGILSTSGRLGGWSAVVLLVPWAGFWLLGWVARLQSNLAGALLIVVLTVVEAVLLAWLFRWSIHGSTVWTMYAAAILIAGVYNLFTCDWIAEKVE